MIGFGLAVILIWTLFYFFIYLFKGKSFKWHYLIHTAITMYFVTNQLSVYWSSEYDKFAKIDIMATYSFILMGVIFVITITQPNRKPYTELLKKEIWGEWAEYENK